MNNSNSMYNFNSISHEPTAPKENENLFDQNVINHHNVIYQLINNVNYLNTIVSSLENQVNIKKPTTFEQFCGRFYDLMSNNEFKETKKLFRRIFNIAVPLLVSLGLYKLDISGRQGKIKLLKLQLSNNIIDEVGYQSKYNEVVRLSDVELFVGCVGSLVILSYSMMIGGSNL